MDISEVFKVTKEIGAYSAIPAIGVLIWNLRRIKGLQVHIGILAVLAFSLDQLSSHISKLGLTTTNINLSYGLVELIIVLFIFKSLLDQRDFKLVYVVIPMMILVHMVASRQLLPSETTIYMKYIQIEACVIIPFCLTFLYQLLSQDPLVPLARLRIFWVVVGFLIYYTTTFFMWVTAGTMGIEMEIIYAIWIINHFATVLKHSTFVYFLWKPQPN